MALITISSDVSIDANSNTFGLSGVAAADLDAGSACYINTASGLVAMAKNTNVFAGFSVLPVKSGRPVTLFRMAKITSYSESLTPGTLLYMSGTAGVLSDAPIVEGDPAVALVVNETDIIVIA